MSTRASPTARSPDDPDGWFDQRTTLARRMEGLGGAVTWPIAVRRFLWRACYEALAKRVSMPDWAFMNYGYAVDVDPPPLSSSDERDRLCIQLYLHAIDHLDLRDRDVLEVGSGRGGGAFHRPFRAFAGIKGTRNYAGLQSGKLSYVSAQLAKSSPAPA
jgi:hypothetical protein